MVKLIDLTQVEAATTVEEGLPFWLLWLLIAFIGLLLFFIFLRDKDLRRRIDFFFLNARNRSLQIHLRRQMKREEKKKKRLWLDLGRIVYENKLALEGTEAILKSLDSLIRKKQQILHELNYFQNNLKITPAEKSPSLSSGQESNSGVTSNSKASFKAMIHFDQDSPKSKAAWPRKKNKLREKIKALDEQAKAFLITLGRITDTLRFKNEKLIPLYEKIDSVNLRLSHLEQRLDSLHPF